MPPKLVLLGNIALLIGFLRIEQKRNPAASISLWIPTLWFLIMASRPVGSWLSPTPTEVLSAAEGSPYDRLVLNLLTLLGLLVLFRRRFDWSLMCRDNLWLLSLYAYLLVSILWSDFPYSSFKRWFKITGTIIMAFVVMSERSPLKALESVLRRCAYVLVPLSLVLTKYFPEYGVKYHRWEGIRMGTGVTTHKNSLGVLCALMSFTLIWALLRRWRSGELFKNKYHTLADTFVLGIALFILFGAAGTYSATSIFIFIIGTILLLALFYMKNLTRYVANNLRVVVATAVILFLVFNSMLLPMVTSFLGRDASLTDRDVIWSTILGIASKNPLLGVGYGGYWGLVNESILGEEILQSHNGYLEAYFEVGIVGILALIAFLLEFCGKIRREYNFVFDWGVYAICFLLMMLLYNYTEADFMAASLVWTMTIFITVVLSAPIVLEDTFEIKEIKLKHKLFNNDERTYFCE